jgi:hypothetical protein
MMACHGCEVICSQPVHTNIEYGTSQRSDAPVAIVKSSLIANRGQRHLRRSSSRAIRAHRADAFRWLDTFGDRPAALDTENLWRLRQSPIIALHGVSATGLREQEIRIGSNIVDDRPDSVLPTEFGEGR